MNADMAMMNRAARLGARGIGRVEPNPLVGCIITDESGEIIGRGWHQRFGGPHAEANALEDCRQGGRDPHGSTLYVTLEPCNHTGKTPPCTEAIIAAGIARCVIARRDPSAAGGGARRLESAGIQVDWIDCPRAARLTDSFMHRIATKRPWVIVKWAQTLDGAIATRDGRSRWISNASSRAAVHRLRARMDVIMTGVGTVLSDDPMLTPRNTRRIARPVRRVIVDPSLITPIESQIVRTAVDVPTTIAVDATVAASHIPLVEQFEERGVEILSVTPLQGDVDLTELLETLADRHRASRVLVEAGGGLVGKLLRSQLVDEVITYIAPTVLGDAEAIGPVRGLNPKSMDAAAALRLVRIRQIGSDVEAIYRPARQQA
ncbi:MAG: bifunctional diaminohydroxyphosphoribosylaminopyrimidine deaminase/5-amino-6-(5-phosphoribosylamino)uracil reductase RibD [Phycisphaerales bacterium]|nr:bifunctional diaminohydroxyphosphoribosylaminopyrimidine deaminase/5-amino-6-(5-phosphoribosylamino)uracil reductase RibD [Phycisphaerales bacterium]